MGMQRRVQECQVSLQSSEGERERYQDFFYRRRSQVCLLGSVHICFKLFRMLIGTVCERIVVLDHLEPVEALQADELQYCEDVIEALGPVAKSMFNITAPRHRLARR